MLREQNKKWQNKKKKKKKQKQKQKQKKLMFTAYRPKLSRFFFLFQKQNPALSLKHYFHVLDVNVEVNVVVFSAILIAFWMPTVMKNSFDVAVYQKMHYG